MFFWGLIFFRCDKIVRMLFCCVRNGQIQFGFRIVSFIMDVMEEEEEYIFQEYRDYLDEEEEELFFLNEGDEAISLYDILVERDKFLIEEELWVFCRECCFVLEVVNNSSEMFQILCVISDIVVFDGVGNVCFLDLDRGLCIFYKNNCVNVYVCFFYL